MKRFFTKTLFPKKCNQKYTFCKKSVVKNIYQSRLLKEYIYLTVSFILNLLKIY